MQDNNLKKMVNIVGEKNDSGLVLNPVGKNTEECLRPFENPMVNSDFLVPSMQGNFIPYEYNAQAFEPHQGVFQQQFFDGRVQLSLENQREMMKYACKKSIDYQVDKAEIELRTNSSMVKEFQKQKLHLEKIKIAEKMKIENENRRYGIYQDSEGVLSIQTFTHEGETIICSKLLNISGLVCEKLESEFHGKSYCIFHVYWNEESEGTWFLEQDFNSKTLSKKMLKKGVALVRAKSKSIEMWELIFAYLNTNCKEIYIPCVNGWNMVNDEWIYVKPGCLTFSEVINKCY